MTALATDSGRKAPARLASRTILGVQSDDRLVKLVRAGHERAFDAIVDRYRRPLVRYCRRILPESRCEDAVQQAFLNAHAALTTSDDAVQLKAWLFAITRNAALNMLRQNGWNYEEIPLDFDGVPRPDQIFEQRIELQQTVAAVNELPERQRNALVMRELEGRSYDEIARALGANDGAVRQLLNRARVTLRSAASALVPPPLLARAASMPPSDGRRLAEILGGMGAAGIAKAGATAVVAGTLVVGAVKAPLPIGQDHVTREKATLAADKPSAVKQVAASSRPIANHPTAAAVTHPARTHAPAVKQHQRSDQSGHGHSGSGGEPRQVEHEGRTEDRQRSGSDDSGTRERSGSDDSTQRTTETEDRSGSDGGGSDDSVIATLPSTDDGSTSGSESSGSGTSGSGETSSGSDDSIDSGSGSTSSDSGSADSTQTSE